MGVGVYRDDFNGTGRSVNVDAPLTEDKDYKAYVKEEKKAGETPRSRDEWDQDQYNQANETMIDVVESTCQEVGLYSVRNGTYGGRRPDFSDEFTGIADGDAFSVGWRSWEIDFVVAIGPSSGLAEVAEAIPGMEAETVIGHGMAPKVFKAAYDKTLGEFEQLIRYALLRAGLETARPTSSYTQSRDEAPKDIEERIEALTASVKAGIARLTRPAEKAMAEASAEERVEMARAILDANPDDLEGLPQVLVATYIEGGSASLWQPDVQEGGLLVSATMPGELRGYMDTLPKAGDGIAAIPLNAETEAWFSARQAKSRGRHVVISAEQYAEITGRDCVVHWRDDETKERGSYTLAEAPAPAMAPAA